MQSWMVATSQNSRSIRSFLAAYYKSTMFRLWGQNQQYKNEISLSILQGSLKAVLFNNVQ